MQSYFNCYFLSYTKNSRTFVDSFSGFLQIKSSSLSINVNLISQKQLHSEKQANYVTRHLASSAASVSILFVKREDTIRKKKFLLQSEKNPRNGLLNVTHELSTQEPGEVIIILLPKLQLFENVQLNCKWGRFSNPSVDKCGILISGPCVWTVIMSEPILKKLSSPSTDNNLKSLRHSMLYLSLSPNDSLMSPDNARKKLNTKGSAPDENEKGLLADSCDLIYVVLGWSGDEPADSIEVFNVTTQKWTFFQRETRFQRAYHGVALLGSHLYIIGGFNGLTSLASTLSLNVQSRQWRKRAPMSTPRCYIFSLACRGYVYAIGGHNGENRMKSCEKFDPRRNRWNRISDMMYRRSDAAGAELNGKIFVCGGFDGFQLHSATEVYNPEYDQWTLIARLIHPRSGHCMVNFEGQLFVFGGFNGRERLREVEKFNEETSQWESFVSMKKGRSNFCCAIFQQQIYAIGGFDGESTSSHVEKFDKSMMEWLEAPSINVHRSAAGACVSTNSEGATTCALNEHVPVLSTDIEGPSP